MLKSLNISDLRNDLQQNPNKYLDDQGRVSLVGEKTTAYCPVCNTEQRIEILESDRGKCLNCKHELALNLQ